MQKLLWHKFDVSLGLESKKSPGSTKLTDS